LLAHFPEVTSDIIIVRLTKIYHQISTVLFTRQMTRRCTIECNIELFQNRCLKYEIRFLVLPVWRGLITLSFLCRRGTRDIRVTNFYIYDGRTFLIAMSACDSFQSCFSFGTIWFQTFKKTKTDDTRTFVTGQKCYSKYWRAGVMIADNMFWNAQQINPIKGCSWFWTLFVNKLTVSGAVRRFVNIRLSDSKRPVMYAFVSGALKRRYS